LSVYWCPAALNCPNVGAGKKCKSQASTNSRQEVTPTLKITPAMASGVTGKLWEMSDMVKVLEDWEASWLAA
jgi:hypothetical protein